MFNIKTEQLTSRTIPWCGFWQMCLLCTQTHTHIVYVCGSPFYVTGIFYGRSSRITCSAVNDNVKKGLVNFMLLGWISFQRLFFIFMMTHTFLPPGPLNMQLKKVKLKKSNFYCLLIRCRDYPNDFIVLLKISSAITYILWRMSEIWEFFLLVNIDLILYAKS